MMMTMMKRVTGGREFRLEYDDDHHLIATMMMTMIMSEYTNVSTHPCFLLGLSVCVLFVCLFVMFVFFSFFYFVFFVCYLLHFVVVFLSCLGCCVLSVFFHQLSLIVCLFVCLLLFLFVCPVCFFAVFFHLLSLMRKGADSIPTLPSTDFCLVKGGPILIFFWPKIFFFLSFFSWLILSENWRNNTVN